MGMEEWRIQDETDVRENAKEEICDAWGKEDNEVRLVSIYDEGGKVSEWPRSKWWWKMQKRECVVGVGSDSQGGDRGYIMVFQRRPNKGKVLKLLLLIEI